MNVDTLALINRRYSDVVDDILTAVVGGIVNEPIPFDVKLDRYALSQPATAIRSVKGVVPDPSDPQQKKPVIVVFQANVDYAFSPNDNSVLWLKGGNAPLDETTFFVDYFKPGSTSPLTDINVGSVVRTICEAIGREISTVYAEIGNAYEAGFVDTAVGQSLDYVVSILDVIRAGADYAVGLVTFIRQSGTDGNITIPQGTEVATAKRVTFETTQLRTLQQGQQRLDVPIRAGAKFKGAAGVVAAGDIVSLSVPILGIEKVTNFDATVLGAKPESDDDLRLRAKSTLQGIGKGTIAALSRVIFDERSKLLEIRDPNGPPSKTSPNGTVSLLVSTEPARYPSVNGTIQETRAAGVRAAVLAQYVFVEPRIVVKLTTTLTAAGKIKLVTQMIDALQTYIDTLQSGQAADGTAMLGALKKLPELQSATLLRFVDVLTSRADINDPGYGALADAIVNAVLEAGAKDADTLHKAVSSVITSELQPSFSFGQIPDRSFLQGTSGKPATDQDIEAGTFKVVPLVDNNPWSVALIATAADFILTGP